MNQLRHASTLHIVIWKRHSTYHRVYRSVALSLCHSLPPSLPPSLPTANALSHTYTPPMSNLTHSHARNTLVIWRAAGLFVSATCDMTRAYTHTYTHIHTHTHTHTHTTDVWHDSFSCTQYLSHLKTHTHTRKHSHTHHRCVTWLVLMHIIP